jgi:parvulin-like peptidyl-prolyl isomerase
VTVLRRQIPGWTLAFSLLLLGGVAAGARGDGTHANPTVAVVDGVAIDADTVRWEMVRHGADFLPRFAKLEEREAVVEELVRIEVLAQKARQEGYLDDPEIRRSLTRMLAEKYWRDQVEAMAPPAVSAADARAYYDSHRAEFTPPRKVRGAVIVLRWASSADPAERAEKRAEAARIAAAAKGITPLAFAALASTHSQDPATRRSGGDTGFIVEGTTLFQFEPPVVDALFAMDQVGGVVSVGGERGAYVVRLTAREGGDTAAFADVETTIRERLAGERKVEQQNERYAELRRHCDVSIDRQVLSQVGPEDLSASLRPPSFPVAEQGR